MDGGSLGRIRTCWSNTLSTNWRSKRLARSSAAGNLFQRNESRLNPGPVGRGGYSNPQGLHRWVSQTVLLVNIILLIRRLVKRFLWVSCWLWIFARHPHRDRRRLAEFLLACVAA